MRDERNKYDLTETKPERVMNMDDKKQPSLEIYNANLLDQFPNKFTNKSITIDTESLIIFLLLFLIIVNLIIIKKVFFTAEPRIRLFSGGSMDV